MAKDSVALVRPLRDPGKCTKTFAMGRLQSQGACKSQNAQAQVLEWRCGWFMACCVLSRLPEPRQLRKQPLLNRMPVDAAEAEINRGFAAVDAALYGKAEPSPVTPFFRFPGFASNQPLLEWLERRHIAVFGADLWASDWNPMTPRQQLALV